jgi:ABC-type amino acid transport substrate-binding protein
MMHGRWKNTLLVVFCFLSRVADSAPQPLNVGMMEYHPFLIHDGDEPKGLIIDYTREMLASLQRPIVFHKVPVNRAAEQLRNHHLDIMLVLYKTEAREKSVLYADEPLLHLGQGFCTHQPLEKKPLTSSSRLAYVRGTVIPASLHGMSEFPVTGDRTQERMLQMLNKGRVDAVHSPMPGVLILAAQNAKLNIALYCYEIKDTRLPVYIAFSSSLEPALRKKLESMQKKRLAEEDFDSFVKRRLTSQGLVYPPVTLIEASQLPPASP